MAGLFQLEFEPTIFDVDEYDEFCQSVSAEADSFRANQAIATDREAKR